MTEKNLKQKLSDDLKQALKAGDRVKVSTLRLVLSAVHNAEIARRGAIDDGAVLSVISKEVRQRKESIEAFKQGNRQDLVDKEAAEMALLQEYLPAQMTREQIAEAARKVIAEVGAAGPSDKGKVMGRLIAQLKGKAEGREINEVVSELLSL